MRIEFVVTSAGSSWTVRRGHTSPITLPAQERAVGVAHNLTRMAADARDIGIVTLIADDAAVDREVGSRTPRAVETQQGSVTVRG